MAKRPRDLNQMAKLVVDIASGAVEDTVSNSKKSRVPPRGQKGGLVGGKSRAAKLTADRRSKIAKDAAKSRWSKAD